ncbi:YhcN/YlaJ family sporulation lipoprotein [Paenibacillus sp. CMAA1739]|uniref:YhcN/YlaJ family sporulation lipoprotein n=1 Tax=Paenibacillus ottowii TaxID=2315729 RepID=UPI002731DA43|nr:MULTISPECIES: YhcN/YlaJ family sporulation lipoprotein [Paenibacillus]MDP1511469.1 YhcN/YlaJ family sporulation lipoprotein [Paenibacillus ottowii]MEC4568437.1 YhcN/YlaJ family sporulation lipoprotein [Paenibacillus sp. CMAA1739]
MPGTKKVISLTISAALLASMATLTGCGTANHNVRTNATRYNTQSTHHLDGVNRYGLDGVNRLDGTNRLDGVNRMDGVNRYGVKSNGINGVPLNENANRTGHPVRNLQVDRNLSKRISEMPDVKSATVLVGERHAYVAVSLKDQGNGTGVGTPGHNGTPSTNIGRNGNVPSVNGVTGTRGDRTTGTTTPGMTDNGLTGTGTPARRDDGLYGTMGTGSYGMIRGLADGTRTDGARTDGTRTDGTTVEGARTAYEPSALTEDVKSRIANKVKQFAPSIEQVYVSANPEFIKHTTDLSRNVQNGHPVRGLSNQLVDVLERVFPTHAAGTNHPTLNTPTRPQNHTPAPMNHR